MSSKPASNPKTQRRHVLQIAHGGNRAHRLLMRL